jgi:hypothetical protein
MENNLKYIKPERLFLADHPELNERWVQQRIAEDPIAVCVNDASTTEVITRASKTAEPSGGVFIRCD